MSIAIRVSAKTAGSEFRIVSVSDDGALTACDCGGFDGVFCSHIDAVLVAQERAMVAPEDWALADRAVTLIAGRLTTPQTWKGSWRKNLSWRGLSSRGAVRRTRERDRDKPLVCFTGTLDRPRALLLAEARGSGWETIDAPSPFTDVLVAADPSGSSGKLKAARKNGTPIVTLDEWAALITDGALPAA